jgi:hypothetical protein
MGDRPINVLLIEDGLDEGRLIREALAGAGRTDPLGRAVALVRVEWSADGLAHAAEDLGSPDGRAGPRGRGSGQS